MGELGVGRSSKWTEDEAVVRVGEGGVRAEYEGDDGDEPGWRC
jgi:hypothetical protein